MVDVFDDKRSMIHLIAGMLAVFSIVFFIIFVLYETAEYIYKHRRKKETADKFIGDLLEFLCGYGFVSMAAGAVYGGG